MFIRRTTHTRVNRSRPSCHRTGARLCVLAVYLALILLMLSAMGCRGGDPIGSIPRIIVLGFDGVDYQLTRAMMEQGRMPHFSRLAEMGFFQALGTSVPAQSPVAWSNFITGMDSGGHGIFDFLHRDPEMLIPEFSMARTVPASHYFTVGDWRFPLVPGRVELLRRGTPFWEVLEQHGIETTIIRMPANFPPSGSASYELSGMGTPDLIGTYGTFSLYTSENFAYEGKEVGGGRIDPLVVRDHVVEATLYGPANPYRVPAEEVALDFRVFLDPVEAAAKVEIGGSEFLLRQGEWSEWVPVDFGLMPTQKLRGMCRFFLKQVRPDFELYVTPINFDPRHAALPIAHPSSFAASLSHATGRFYTQGMPEDTSALGGGVFSREEFLTQAAMAGEENIRQFRHIFQQFKDGFLFHYFGNVDQVSHVLWRARDPQHPAYDAAEDIRFESRIDSLYQELDDLVGYTIDRMGDNTVLIVMSDHGFTSWRRAFHLNAWLRENGFLAVRDRGLEEDPGGFANIDWSRTLAYNVGFNGIYVNLQGRERFGIVKPQQRKDLVDEIADKLKVTVDPKTGKPAVAAVYPREQVYSDRGSREQGPDLVVGFSDGIRVSDESSLGAVSPEVFSDNVAQWSGDHMTDPGIVPGILLASRALKKPVLELTDLAAAILWEFGVETPFPAKQ